MRLFYLDANDYICKLCNRDAKKEAQDASGIDPETVDKFEKANFHEIRNNNIVPQLENSNSLEIRI